MSDKILKKNSIEQITFFVKKNYKAFILLLITLFTLLFIFLILKNLEEKKNIKISEQYTRASILIKQKKIEEGKSILKAIIKENHKFYSPLALYLIIDKNIESDEEKIIILFDKILKNKSIDKENLNLIKIKKSIYLINLDNEKLILETLNPIITSDSIWRNIAINIMSGYFISKGQKIKAKEYNQLLNNETIR